MSLKRIICTAVVVAGYLILTAFAPDCMGDLTKSVNKALDQYEKDGSYCRHTASIFSISYCLQEAEASKNSSIDAAVEIYYNC